MINKKIKGMSAALLSAVLISACTMGQTPAPTADMGIINTQAAQLVATQFSMQQTQTAMAIPPSPFPTATVSQPTFAVISTPFTSVNPNGAATPLGGLPTPFGALPTSGFLPTSTVQALATASGPKCDDAIFTGQENVPDGTVMKPGIEFEKYWVIQNTGTCTWDDGYIFTYLGGTLDGYNIKINKTEEFVKPGGQVTFKVNLTSSLVPNTYTDCWAMKNDRGFFFGQSPIACVNIVVKK
jgi:hypothetical protein